LIVEAGVFCRPKRDFSRKLDFVSIAGADLRANLIDTLATMDTFSRKSGFVYLHKPICIHFD